jgi:hypothetical protein
MLERERVSLAVVEGGAAERRISRVDARALDAGLFSGQPTDATVAALTAALQDLLPEAGRAYLPLHVSVPGAAVQIAVFPLDALPKKRVQQLELVRWHFTQDGNAAQGLVCDCEPLGVDNGKHLLLGFAMDQAWHACVVEALSRAGVTAWSLNADVCRQFNRFHDLLCKAESGGALLAVSSDAWSLLLWDAQGRVRHCSSRWRSRDAGEAVRVAVEVERRIVASVQSFPGLQIEHLYLLADQDDAAIADAIDARLREPCVRLDPALEGGANIFPTTYSGAPIAAALQS